MDYDYAKIQHDLEQARLDIDTLKNQMMAYNRILKANPGLLQIQQNAKMNGIMTFEQFPITPSSAPTADYEVAPKKYVDDIASGGVPSMCAVYHNADQEVQSGTEKLLNFNSELYDTDGLHDISTNNSRLTASKDGVWSIWAALAFEANATNDRFFRIYINGVYRIVDAQIRAATASATTDISLYREFYINKDDYVEVKVNQSSGSPLDLIYDPYRSAYFGMSYKGPTA